MPKARTKTPAQSAALKRQHHADRGDDERQAPLLQQRAQKNGLEDEPFGNESIERRQRGNRHRAAEEEKGRARHGVDEAAELFDVALARGVENRAGAEEEQAFVEGMIENMKERGGEGERRRPIHVACMKGQSEAERRQR